MRHLIRPKSSFGVVFIIALVACLCVFVWQNKEPLTEDVLRFLIERNINKAASTLLGQKVAFEDVHVKFVGDELRFSTNAVLDHIDISGFDLSTQIDVEGIAFRRPGRLRPGLTAHISTSGSVLNYAAFEELSGTFNIEGSLLKVSSLKLGEEYEISGEYEFSRPWQRDLLITIRDADFNRLISLAGARPKKRTVYGPANGQIRISGPAKRIITVGHLTFASGVVKSLPYKLMTINLRGEGPILEFVDSKILREDGSLKMKGNIDFRKLSSAKSPRDALELSYESETIIWDGWDITKPLESDEIKMKKHIGSDIRVTFMGYLNNEQSWDATDEGEEVGVEYMLNDNQKVKMRLKKDEEFFSLEHNLKF